MRKTISNHVESERYPRLTPEMMDSLKKSMVKNSGTLLMAFRSDIRVFKIMHLDCICVLTPFEVFFFSQVQKKKELLCRIHVSDLELIAYSEEKHVLLRTMESNIVIYSEESLKLAQIFYRNYQLIFSNLSQEESCEIRSSDMSLFPKITISISPSQKFQLAYASICSKLGVEYHHEVVRYVHSLVLSQNGIFDVSQLPLGLYFNASELRPIFLALDLMKFIHGICCSSLERPNILENISLMIEQSKKLRVIHFSDCSIQNGLKLVHESFKANSDVPISYWNLDNNKIKDFDYFPSILAIARSPVLHISLNDCGIKPNQATSLFTVLEQNPSMWTIQNLHIFGIEMNEESLQAFDKFLKTLSDNDSSCLKSLNLGLFKGKLKKLLNSLNRYPQPIESLVLCQSSIDDSAIEEIIVLIKSSRTLRHLDLSGTKLSYESLIQIITTIGENQFLNCFSIDLNTLDLNGKNLLPIFRVFLESDLNMWKSIRLENNKMNSIDLKNIVPLLQMMNNLETLSLSYNFNATMKDIGLILTEILNIPSLKILSIAGADQYALGEQLIPLIEQISRKPIEYLDISGNNIGNRGISSVISFIRNSTSLHSINLCNNNITSMQVWTELAEVVENRANILEFIYPIGDAKNTVLQSDKSIQKEVMKRLSDLQMVVNNSVTSHRIQAKVGHYLPIRLIHERIKVTKLISQISQGEDFPPDSNIHSCVCKEFSLSLPYQRVGENVEDGGDIIQINIGEQDAYKTESMKWIVKENTKSFMPPETIDARQEKFIPAFTSISDLDSIRVLPHQEVPSLLVNSSVSIEEKPISPNVIEERKIPKERRLQFDLESDTPKPKAKRKVNYFVESDENQKVQKVKAPLFEDDDIEEAHWNPSALNDEQERPGKNHKFLFSEEDD